MENQHTCKATAIFCFDFRFARRFYEFLESMYPGSYDPISAAGAVKSLLADGKTDNFLLNQVGLSASLHKTKAIVLIQHEDCGAYGGSKAFANSEAEIAFQKEELQKAEDFLKRYHPNHLIRKFYFTLSGEVVSVQ